MPTASTAQILGNNECFEPYTSNLYARRTLAGEFLVLNPHLQRQLQRLGLWSGELREEIIAAGGSIQVLTRSMRRAAPVRSYGRSGRTSFLAAPRPALSARLAQSYPTLQGIDAIPEHTRDVFKTAWEMKQRTIIDMAAERGAFIDQSQSLNIFMPVRAPRGRWHRLSPGRGCLCCLLRHATLPAGGIQCAAHLPRTVRFRARSYPAPSTTPVPVTHARGPVPPDDSAPCETRLSILPTDPNVSPHRLRRRPLPSSPRCTFTRGRRGSRQACTTCARNRLRRPSSLLCVHARSHGSMAPASTTSTPTVGKARRRRLARLAMADPIVRLAVGEHDSSYGRCVACEAGEEIQVERPARNGSL
eukprot:scaffold142255_cov30-Tisochrysis_lutea.AAC.1